MPYTTVTTPIPYGIRVLTAPITTYSYFASPNTTDAPYEPDGDPAFGGVPTNPAVAPLDQPMNTAILTSADVDWIKITLP